MSPKKIQPKVSLPEVVMDGVEEAETHPVTKRKHDEDPPSIPSTSRDITVPAVADKLGTQAAYQIFIEMTSNSDVQLSMTKLQLNNLHDMRKDSTTTNKQLVVMESSSSGNKSLEGGESLSRPASEVALLGFSPVVKENKKDMKDFLSIKISRLQERVITLEDVIRRRRAAIESEFFFSQEVKIISDSLSPLEENICASEDTNAIAPKICPLEEKICTSEETKKPEDRVSTHEESMCTSEETEKIIDIVSSHKGNTCISEETKAIADGLATLENSISALELTVEKLEEKLTSLTEMKGIEKNSTGKEEEFISKETTLPQHFDTTFKGQNVLLTNASQTAERRERFKEDMFGGVISKFPLKAEEAFQIIIEETNDDYKGFQFGGIAFGVIIDKKAAVEGERSIYNIKGTWAIRSEYNKYSSTNSIKGKSHVWKDNAVINRDTYPLDTRNLPVGAVLGIKLRRNGDLHFILNGLDKGVAFQNVPNNVFAFVDVIGYVTKISIV